MSIPLCVEDARGDLPVFIHSKLDDYGLSPVEFRVYGRLARRAGSGEARESVRNMAAGCKMSERSVQLALKLLELAGLVQRLDRHGLPTLYKLLPPGKWAHPSKLEALRSQITAKWKKPEALTPATIAPVQPLHPRNHCTPPGATIAPKGTPVEGSPSASSSPTAQKKPREHRVASALSCLPEDERAVIEVWRDVTRRYPAESVWPYIVERLAPDFDVGRLRRCGGAYIANYGTGQKHVAGICDWYAEDRTQPERRNHARNERPESGGGRDRAEVGARPATRHEQRVNELRRQDADTILGPARASVLD